jgi:hypothetical protein
VTITVKTPGIFCSPSSFFIGQNLQIQNSCAMGQPAPNGGLPVTLSATGLMKVAAQPGDVGQTAIQISVPAGQSQFVYYLQAFGTGAATYTASAPNFTDATGNITLTPSSLMVTSSLSGLSLIFPSVATGSSVPLTVSTARLDGTNAFAEFQPLRGGFSVGSVTLSSDATGVGTVDSPVNMGSSSSVGTVLHAVGPGQVNISVNQPSGFVSSANGPFSGSPSSTLLAGVN